MPEDDKPELPYPLLACGHRWNGHEDWDNMFVILKQEIDGAPAYSTGHWCRLCRTRPGVEERRLPSIDEANAWLRLELGLR